VSTSCNNDALKTENEVVNIDYESLKLNTQKKISSISAKFDDEAKIRNMVSKYVDVRKVDLSSKKTFNSDFTFHVSLPVHYSDKEKIFMLEFYNELANCYDGKILDLISKKRLEINSKNFSNDFKNEVDFLFYTFEEVTNEVFQVRKVGAETYLQKKSTNGLKECLEKNGASGKDIGRNLVLGAVTGGVSGAYVGGTAGTFTIPGFGTAVGAVGGAVFGAAAGAVSSVVGGLVWPAIDCIRYVTKYEEKYLKVEFFKDEMPFIDIDSEEIQRFNDLLNAPVTSDVKIVE
jgi:hypothetical protein